VKEGLEIQNVRFSYDGQTDVLKDISLRIRPGGMAGIVGPNGAGKTTLLRIISGYLQPESGTVTLEGQDIRGFSRRQMARRMALVPQFSGMEYDFTVKDIVLTGRFAHISRLKAETRTDYGIAAQAMARAGIAHLKDRSVLSLSGGEWQRMIIARALCQQSDMMLLDEPVSHLDMRHQVQLLKTVRSLCDEGGITAVTVLHDLSLTYNFCDTVFLLQEGRLAAAGAPKEVLTPDTIEKVFGQAVYFARMAEKTYILPVL
jgi:iron complex transport system ATP-binding protein